MAVEMRFLRQHLHGHLFAVVPLSRNIPIAALDEGCVTWADCLRMEPVVLSAPPDTRCLAERAKLGRAESVWQPGRTPRESRPPISANGKAFKRLAPKSPTSKARLRASTACHEFPTPILPRNGSRFGTRSLS